MRWSSARDNRISPCYLRGYATGWLRVQKANCPPPTGNIGGGLGAGSCSRRSRTDEEKSGDLPSSSLCLGVHIDILHEYPRLVKSLLEESPLTSPKSPRRLRSPASQAPPRSFAILLPTPKPVAQSNTCSYLRENPEEILTENSKKSKKQPPCPRYPTPQRFSFIPISIYGGG